MTLNDWLAPRLALAPPDLAGAIRELLREADSAGAPDHGEAGDAETIPARLAAAALCGIDGVACGDEVTDRRRGTALRLLAADAALTYAFEAAADLGGDVVGLAARLGPRGALGDRLATGGVPEATPGEVS